ncbi:MAG: pyridoxal phosphate-dependent aminotransferase family protein [Candidatus Nitrotoga sp.]
MKSDDLVLRTKELGEYTLFPKIRSACSRELTLEGGKKVLNFASCDYLGFANHERIKQAAIDGISKYGTNISGPMIFSGYTEYHEKLENSYSELFNGRSCLMFTTSYQANIGVIPMLAEELDLILMDKISHVSLYDGLKLSGAKFKIYPHSNMDVLTGLVKMNSDKRILIITDGVFSADGDFANLADFYVIKQMYPNVKIYIDDAHGVGMLGDNGQGLVQHLGFWDYADFIVGTMSKSFGTTGGFVVFKNSDTANRIRYRCSTYNASRAVSPGVAAASCMALQVNKEEGLQRRQHLSTIVEFAHKELALLGVNKLSSTSAIIPIVFPDPLIAAKVNHTLNINGVLGSLFVPPYVEKRKSRIRLGITYNHTTSDITRLAEILDASIKPTNYSEYALDGSL